MAVDDKFIPWVTGTSAIPGITLEGAASGISPRARSLVTARNLTMGGGKTKPSAKDYPTDGLLVFWDGIENGGYGIHDDAPTELVDLSGNGHNLKISQGKVAVGEKSITTDGAILAAYCEDSASLSAIPQSYEYVVRVSADIASIRGMVFASGLVNGPGNANSSGNLGYVNGYYCLNAWRTLANDGSIMCIGQYGTNSWYADAGNGAYTVNGENIPYALNNIGSANGGRAWGIGGVARSDIKDRIYTTNPIVCEVFAVRIYSNIPTPEDRARCLALHKARFGF